MKTHISTIFTLILHICVPASKAGGNNPCDADYNGEFHNQFKCERAYWGSPEQRQAMRLPMTQKAMAEDRFILDCIKDLAEYQEEYCKANTSSVSQDNDKDINSGEAYTLQDNGGNPDEDSFLQDDRADVDDLDISPLLELLSIAVAAENEKKCEQAYIGSSDEEQTSKLATTERALAKEKYIMDCVDSLTEFQLENIKNQ